MTRQVALGAVLGFTIMVVLTSLWPQSSPPMPPSPPLEVLKELPPGLMEHNPTPEMIRPRAAAQQGPRQPTKFINPNQAVPQAAQ